MMKTTKLKIEKALKHFESTDFSIREVAEKSGVSYPTIKNYLSNLPIREVSYGRYEIIGTPKSIAPTAPTPLGKTETKTTTGAKTTKITVSKPTEQTNQTVQTDQTDQTYLVESPNEMNSFRESLKNELLNNEEISKEIYGEIYIAAYLKGFDRGFELGIAKARIDQ